MNEFLCSMFGRIFQAAEKVPKYLTNLSDIPYKPFIL